jgi:hypothetical protein
VHFLITVLLVTVQFEILFFIKFYKMQSFVLFIYFLAMLLAHRTLHYFGKKEQVSLIECLQSWTSVGEKHLSLLVLRLPLGPQKEGFHGIDTQKPVTFTQMPCDVGKLIFMSSSLSTISIDLTPLKPEACWDLTHQDWFCPYVRQSGLFSDH